MSHPVLSPKANATPPVIIDILKNLFDSRCEEIGQWFQKISNKTPPFFYNSVDLRHSGFKLAPVDTNLFPAGFNNLNPRERDNAQTLAKDFFAQYYPDVHDILILAEDHTRNKYYLENLVILSSIIKGAGKNVEISNPQTAQSGEQSILESFSGQPVTFAPLTTKDHRLQTNGGFVPDFILVNNDLTGGAPDLLKGLTQFVSPPVEFGWHQRRKTSHFETYNTMARDFCHQFGLDPWLITTYFQRCGVVNFKERTGIDCVAMRVDQTLERIRKKYDEYGITETPYVFIKSDRGTYGMGIMTAKSGAEVLEIGKDIRKKMDTIKGGIQNTEVIIQEGVPTIDTVNGNPAEPMIYMLGGQPAGCIYRLNTRKDAYGNLNASGMQFDSIENHSSDKEMCCAYGLISKIASYASAWECYQETYNI